LFIVRWWMVSGEREALRLYKSNKCIDNETLKEYSKSIFQQFFTMEKAILFRRTIIIVTYKEG